MKHGRNVRLSVIFWCWVTYSGVWILVPISGKMNSLFEVIETLYKHLHCNTSQSPRNMLESPHFHFKDVNINAPCHAPQLTAAWKNF